MQARGLIAVAAAIAAVTLGGCTSCPSTVRSFAVPAIAGARFDGAAIDQSSHVVYLADRTNTSVAAIDVSGPNPFLVGTVKLPGAPSGLAFASDRRLLYAAVGSAGVAVIDPRSLAVTQTMAVQGARVDLIDYSPQTGNLYLGAESSVLEVDATSGALRHRLTTSAPAGQPRFDPADGMVYVTVPGVDSLLQVDPASGYVTRTYVVRKCHPSGLGINPARQLALMSCGSSVVLMNLQSGSEQATRTVQGGDIVTYDAAADRFVVASPHGLSDSTVGVFTGDGQFIGSVPATPAAHAAVYDASQGIVYAPGPAGLMSFAPAQCEPPPDWLKFAGGLSIFAVPLVAFGLLLGLYARRLKRGQSGPTDHELQEQDLELERERMRELEDAIYGPEP